MITYLDNIDQQVTMAINGFHVAYMDKAMWMLTSVFSWVLMLIAFLWILRDKGWRSALVAVVAVALTIVFIDQLTSGFIKPTVARLRPSHNPALAATIHLVNGYQGGMFGFVSGHAANSFGVAMIMGLMLRHRPAIIAMIIWAILQCYSRMYLGVHYLGDILCGTVLGLLVAWLVYWLLRFLYRKFSAFPAFPAFTRNDGKMIASSVVVTILTIFILAIFI
ncbi:MAG: phosphatase PAP2 family protein [Muribaculaceae bacterium]|nr:phosphatase PAP2 family protein [Muribaculaceae bacterium]